VSNIVGRPISAQLLTAVLSWGLEICFLTRKSVDYQGKALVHHH